MEHDGPLQAHGDHVVLKQLFPLNTDPAYYYNRSKRGVALEEGAVSHCPGSHPANGSPSERHRLLAINLEHTARLWPVEMQSTTGLPFARPEKRVKLQLGQIQDDRAQADGENASITGSPHPRSSIDRNMSGHCQECSNADHLVEMVVAGILELQMQISRTLRSFHPHLSPKRATDTKITRHGLKAFLTWAIDQIRMSSQALHDLTHTTQSGLPSLTEAITMNRPEKVQSPRAAVLSPLILPNTREFRRPSLPPDIERTDVYAGRSTDVGMEARFAQSDHGMTPINLSAEPRRHLSQDQYSGFPAPFLHRSSTGSQANAGQSPTQSHISSYALPSPPISHHTGIVPATSGPYGAGGQGAQNAHFQDLQHQISTKTLALQTLQREHDQLLAAFSRSQMRCSTLDKKSQVADHEINTLLEEKSQLQKQLEMVEEQVAELSRSRDELHQQLTNDSAQWRRIMAMSSQLEIRSAEEARKYKADREEWERQRTDLEKRIRELEEAAEQGVQPPACPGRELSRDQAEHARQEALARKVEGLRVQCTDMYSLLSATMNEVANIDQAIAGLDKVRQKFKDIPGWTEDSLRETG